ncbi:MAG: polysaccharide biosynthesis protein, partial [Acidobacteriota bacterium]
MTDVQTAAPTSSARTLMMRRCVRLAAKALLDASLVAVAFSGAVLVRFGVEIPRTQLVTMRHLLPYVVVLKLLTFFYFRLGRDLWRYASFSSLVRMARAIGIASLLVVTFTYLVGLGSLPRSVFVVDGVFTLLLIAAPRLLVRWLRERSLGGGGDDSDQRAGEVADGAMEKVLLVGAGEAGELMARDMNAHARKLRMRPIGFVDDNPGKQGMLVHGLPVLGGREAIPVICDDFSVARIVLCMPYVAGKSIREIIRYCHLTGVRVDIMPRLGEILSGRAKISDLRAVKVEDLLGRAKIDFNMDDVCSYVQGRRVLVTGAGGSIGSELCRQIVRYGPAEIGLLGRGENSIFSIAREISRVAPGVKRHEIIGDVINRRKLEGVFAGLKPEIIFHAGADKHVPLMELNPDEAVLNNIIGTSNVLQVADEAGTELVVAISTDKAVRPSSVMGCCKRVAEMLIQSGRTRRVKAVAVRFGNVLGSRGSVIPTFQHQIDQGGPVTVTHPRMERYFMTIPEAAALVLQAGA